jgi:cell division protein FtsQ
MTKAEGAMSAPTPIRKRIIPAGAAMAVAAFLAAGAWLGVQAIPAQPAGRVVFAGELERIEPRELEALSQSIQGAGSDGASLAAIREAARRLPWVREATVRKNFPDVVEISLQAHVPLARWSDDRLISTRGELFHGELQEELPRFFGPESAAPDMTRRYEALARLSQPLGSPIREMHVSARGAWQLVLASGLTLELGRDDIESRLARFASAWPQLPGALPGRHVDLRYANGFAVQLAQAGEKRK